MSSKRIVIVSLLTFTLCFVSLLAFAGMKGGMKGHSMGQQVFSGKAFGMELKGEMMDIKAQMSSMGKGMKSPEGITHHLMVKSEGPMAKEVSGKVTIIYPNGEKKDLSLPAMGEHIGSDLNLDQKGTYKFHLVLTRGSEAAGFAFEYEVK